MKEWFKQNKIVIFIASLGLLTVAAPFIFTRTEFLGIVFDGNTGPIGDTIGGITAPFLGFLSIILLYITLKRQVDFNDKQDKFNQQQIDFNDKQIKINEEQLNLIKKQDERDSVNSDFALLFNLQKQVDELFENITIDGKEKGVKALISLIKNDRRVIYQDLLILHREAVIIIMLLVDLFDKIKDSSIPKLNKRILFSKAKKDMFWIEEIMRRIAKKDIEIIQGNFATSDFESKKEKQIEDAKGTLRMIEDAKKIYEVIDND